MPPLSTTSSPLPQWLNLAIVPGLLLAFMVIAGDSADWRYQRDEILAGEWWRMVSAHLAHLSWPHTGLNAAGLVLLVALFGRAVAPWQWLIAPLFLAVGSSLVYLYWLTYVEYYVGLSGVLHGMMVIGGFALVRQAIINAPHGDKLTGFGLLAIVTTKLIWENLHGASTDLEHLIDGPVLTESHLVGALLGLLWAIPAWWLQRRSIDTAPTNTHATS